MLSVKCQTTVSQHHLQVVSFAAAMRMTTPNTNLSIDADITIEDACRILTSTSSETLSATVADVLWYAVTSSEPSLRRILDDCPHNFLELLVFSIEDDATRFERCMFMAYYYIATNADLKLIEKIWNRGIHVDCISPSGWTLLHLAIHWGHVNLVEKLLESGADVNITCYHLFEAATLSNNYITLLLIKKGANIHACDEQHESAIHSACRSQSTENIVLLLQLGADIKAKNLSGQTPISLMSFDNFSLDDPELLPTAQITVILHLALLYSKGQKIDNSDFQHIRQNPSAWRFYNHCLGELREMKNSKIYNNISFFDFLEKSTDELAVYMRNKELVDSFNYHNNLRITRRDFPLYSAAMTTKFSIALTKENIASLTTEPLTDIFQPYLPEPVTYMVAYRLYSDEWKNADKNHYLRLYDVS